MSLRAHCPKCGDVVNADDAAHGTVVKCPQCGQRLLLRAPAPQHPRTPASAPREVPYEPAVWRNPAVWIGFAAIGTLAIIFVTVMILEHQPYRQPQVATQPDGATARPADEARQAFRPAAVPPGQPAASPPPSVVVAKPSDQEIAQDMKNGWAAIEAKRWTAAGAILARLKALTPDDPEVWRAFGELQLGLDNCGDAVQAFQTAIRLNPNEAKAYGGLGKAYLKMGREDDARAAIKKAIELVMKPGSLTDFLLRGWAYQEAGRYAEAAEAYMAASRLDPNSVEAHLGLASAYDSVERYAEAVESYKVVLRLKPDHASALYRLGLASVRMGQFAEAIAALRSATRLQPNHVGSHFLLGVAYAGTKQWNEATAEWEIAVHLKPELSEAHKRLGAVYSQAGRHAEAVASYTIAIRLKPDDAQAHVGLILAYEAMENHTDATTTYEALQRLNPALAAELKPLFTPHAIAAERPSFRGDGKGDYVFQELGNVNVVPRFNLDRGLSMGNWTYKAFRVSDKNTGTAQLALMLQIELQPVGLTLPPLTVEVQAVSRTNRIVGSGTLFAKRIAVMEKLPYWGLVIVASFSDIDTLVFRCGP